MVIQHKIQTGFAIALAFLLLTGAMTWWSARRNVETFRAVDHTYQVITRLQDTLVDVLDAETGSRGFALSGNEDHLQPYQSGVASVQAAFAAVRQLTQDNPVQQQRLALLWPLIEKRIALADDLIKRRRLAGPDGIPPPASAGQGRQTMEEIRKVIGEMQDEEKQLEQQRTDKAEDLSRWTLAIAGLGSLAAIGLVALAGGLVQRDFRRRREAEEERDRFFTLSLDLLCISKVDGFFKRVNPAFTTVLGWSTEEMLAQPFIKLVHPDDCEVTLREVEKQVVAGKPVLHFENRYRHKAGSWRWLSWKSIPQPGGLMYATARDVTELKQMEQTLRRSEENLSVTLQSIGDAVLATDAEGRVTRLNPVAERLTGWTQAEALGRPVDEVFNIVNEETRRAAVIPVAAVLATGEIQGLANHTVVIARNGAERPIADSAAPIRDKEGRVLGVVLVFRDVTEEKKTEQVLRASEQKLQQFNDELAQLVEDRSLALLESERLARAALDALTAHVAILDEHGVIIATNQGWQNFANQNGLSPEQAGKGTNYLDACARAAGQPSSSAAKMAEGIRDVIAGRKGGFTLEYDCHSPTEKRWFLCRVTRFAGDGAVRVVVAHENITQMRLLERQQIRSQRMESLGALAGGMAHDFNNALSPIMVGMQLLKEKYPGESEIMDMFYVSTKRGADMVRQLLAFARGAEGERNPVQVDHLVREMENIITGSFPKNIRLTVECDPQLPSVLGDTTQIHQVILNLCVNARDAMPDGGTLTLEARRLTVDAVLAGGVPEARPGKYVALRVRDTGTGIPPDVLDRIFDPFFTTKALGKGTGLGLSTVTGIVKGHNGFMKVYSQPGQGSTFTVFLPANDNADDADAKVDSGAGAIFSGSGETILVVDDEPAIRQIVAAVLRRLNLQVVTAADGRDGLAKLAEHRDELRAVITDLHMPNLGGLEFVRRLRQVLPDIPVALTSGRLEKNEEDEFQALNVTVCLNKPFAEGELAAVLQKLLNAAKARS